MPLLSGDCCKPLSKPSPASRLSPTSIFPVILPTWWRGRARSPCGCPAKERLASGSSSQLPVADRGSRDLRTQARPHGNTASPRRTALALRLTTTPLPSTRARPRGARTRPRCPTVALAQLRHIVVLVWWTIASLRRTIAPLRHTRAGLRHTVAPLRRTRPGLRHTMAPPRRTRAGIRCSMAPLRSTQALLLGTNALVQVTKASH